MIAVLSEQLPLGYQSRNNSWNKIRLHLIGTLRNEFLFDPSHMPPTTTIATAEAGAVRFYPCEMWEQTPATALVYLAQFG